MIGRTLKYVIVTTTALMSFTKGTGCPICIEKGQKKRFKIYHRPQSRSIYAKKRASLRETTSHKKTGASTLKEELKKLPEHRGEV